MRSSNRNTVRKTNASTDMPFILRMGTFAASACFADFATFPLDTAKVRLQVQGEKKIGQTNGAVYRSLPGTIATIARTEGFRGLFNGLSAGLQRQLFFSSIRFGFYDTVKEFYMNLLYGSSTSSWSFWGNASPTDVVITPVAIYPTEKGDGRDGLNVPVRIAAGMTTGCLCVIVAQPTDVVKIRFQAASRGSGPQRYNSTTAAFKAIYSQEGFGGLWKGTMANAARNSIVNVAEIVVYDTFKQLLLRNALMEDTIKCHFTSAVVAGLCATFVASPVDVIKTRYMNSVKGTYKGALDCAMSTYKKEGPKAFYKGFVPSFYRIATWNIVLWVTFEQLKSLLVRKKEN